MDMNKWFSVFALVGFFVYVSPAFAEMSSSNYQIQWDTVSTGGSDTASSANFSLKDTIGGLSNPATDSTNYQLSDGYRAATTDQVLSFSLLPQNNSDERVVTAKAGLTISSTNTGSLAVGNYIVLVQDKGANQVSAVGRIASIASGTSVTVDSWSDNGTSPVIDGTNDFFYKLNGSSVAFGTLTSAVVSTSVIAFDVTANLAHGYVVQMMSHGGLSNGTHSISDVADGSVTAGSEEYGARSSDTTLAASPFDTQDSAITTSFQDVATESSAKINDRHFVTLKAAISPTTPSGTYAQTITLIASGNF